MTASGSEEPGALAKEEELEEDSNKELSQGEDVTISDIWVNASQQQDGREEGKEQRFYLTRSWRLNVGARQEDPGALAKEEELEEDSDKELSQGEDVTISDIWVNASVPELFQDPHAGAQEGPGWPSSAGPEAAGEAAGGLQSASPAPAGLLDAGPAASGLAGAPEEEGHRAPLAPAAQEEAKAPASPAFAEQATAAQAESQAPAPHSPTASAAALEDAAWCIVREVVRRAVAVTQGPRQQLAEQDLTQSTHAATAAGTPAAPQDTQSPLAGEPQGEASPAPLVPAAGEDGESMASPMSGDRRGEASAATVSSAVHEEEGASPVLENPPADAGTPHRAPAADSEGDAAASPLARDLQHQVAPEHRGDAQPSSGCRDMPEDDPGIAALPHLPAQRRRPSLFRRALRALRRAFRCTCIAGQQE
ncbi:uncharacterized protein LOC142080248 [Calonectris borealis]|uniref:uncharacterized protein LOC142080248 n=1 Tax=Calonectris borealis TaxID=1323832 RepID=UPI003F4BA06B